MPGVIKEGRMKRAWTFAALFGPLLAAACEGPGAHAPTRPLPTYAGHAAELFDDMIEPRAVGQDIDPANAPRADPLLRERAQVGDAVLRVRVATVTAKREDTGTSYQLGFHIVEKLGGSFSPEDGFLVGVPKESPSRGTLASFEGRLVGMNLIIFVRAFVRPDGDQELHFHVGPDSKDEVQAVKDAMALNELK
jgi:hypothetical protein